MGSLIVVTGVIFALQATAVTPLSASTSNQHIQNQQRTVANGLLATADANGDLRQTVVYWNTSQRKFHGASDAGYYTAGGPSTPFGAALNETFRDRGIAFNVYVVYWDGTSRKETPITYMGTPSDNAVRASRTVTIYNSTRLSAPGETDTLGEAEINRTFYAPDVAPGNALYGVV